MVDERLTFFSPDEALATAEAGVEDAAEDIAEATEQLEEMETPAEISEAESRLRAAEGRLASAERAIVELRGMVEGKAHAEHSHPLPGDLQTVADALAEIEEEEHAPTRRKWYERRIFGGGD